MTDNITKIYGMANPAVKSVSFHSTVRRDKTKTPTK